MPDPCKAAYFIVQFQESLLVSFAPPPNISERNEQNNCGSLPWVELGIPGPEFEALPSFGQVCVPETWAKEPALDFTALLVGCSLLYSSLTRKKVLLESSGRRRRRQGPGLWMSHSEPEKQFYFF